MFRTVDVPAPEGPRFPYRPFGMGCVFVGIPVASIGISNAVLCNGGAAGDCSLNLDVVVFLLGVALMVAGFALMFVRRKPAPSIRIRLPEP
jgi:hypothetical protein